MNRVYCLGLWEVDGIGAKRYWDLVGVFGSVDKVFGASLGDLADVVGESIGQRILMTGESIMQDTYDRYASMGVDLVLYGDPAYPSSLLEYDWAPPLLYVKGDLGSCDQALAVIGTRKPTSYGRNVTQTLAADISAGGMCIVSGLALGVDGIGHQAALEAGGKTIAVLGTGIDKIYPAAHGRLAQRIQEQGAVISMFPAGKANRGQFAVRNRLVAGLSKGVLVTEAAENSGTRITVEYAREQGKPIFAVPGPVNGAMSDGPLALLEEGAILVRNAQKVLDHFGASKRMKVKKATLSTLQQQICEALLAESLTLDELQLQVQVDSGELMVELMELELHGIVSCQNSIWAVNKDTI